MLASTLSVWEWLEPLKNLGLDPQKATKLAVKSHAHSLQNAYNLVSTRSAHEKTFITSYCKTRSGVLLVNPLIPTFLFCFLCWWRSHMVLRPYVTPFH